MATVPDLSPAVATLREAFPDTDPEIIEIVLHESRGNTEAAFNQLLSMSDPSYKPEASDPNASVRSPPQPVPRPTIQQQSAGLTSTPADQLAADEALARALAEEGVVRPNRPQHQEGDFMTDNSRYQQAPVVPPFNFQEEFEPIKQRAIEGAQVAKKKVIELYNNFKNRATPSLAGSSSPFPSSSPSPYSSASVGANARYRSLPGDEDFLSAEDLSALRLSDDDVETRTTPPPPPSTAAAPQNLSREERLAQQQAWIQAQREREQNKFTIEEDDRLERRHSPPKGYQIDEAVAPEYVIDDRNEPAKEVSIHATTVSDELIDDDDNDDDDDDEELSKAPVNPKSTVFDS